MDKLFLLIIVVAVLIFCYNPETFYIRRTPARFVKPYTFTRPVQRQMPFRKPVQRQMPFRTLPVSQPGHVGFARGPAFSNPFGTGIVQGSSISGLQQQYRQIFAPRSTATVGSGINRVSMVSGQPQRNQHLQQGGLGRTGWRP